MTNAEHIRSMSNEELAEHNIHTVKIWNRYEGYHEIMYRCSDGYITDDYQIVLAHELEWLQEPAKEDNND